MRALIESAQRTPRQRTTDYRDADAESIERGMRAGELLEIVNTPARKYERTRRHELVNRIEAVGAD